MRQGEGEGGVNTLGEDVTRLQVSASDDVTTGLVEVVHIEYCTGAAR